MSSRSPARPAPTGRCCSRSPTSRRARPPLASRAFLSYEFKNGKFVIQSRKTTSDTTADLADASFYVAWVDFTAPLAPPEGPRFRSVPAVAAEHR